jgi:opine dehydrogenase
VFAQHGLDVCEELLLGETLMLPHSARMTKPARVRIKQPSTVRVAAFRARNNARLYETLGETNQVRPLPNVLDTGLNNVNFSIHPGPMLVNYAAVERANGHLSLMNEGMRAGVLRWMAALDAEKMAIAEALGLEPVSIREGLSAEGDLSLPRARLLPSREVMPSTVNFSATSEEVVV